MIRYTLTHWGRETRIWVSKLTITASGNGLSHGRHQAIIWTNDGILSIGYLGANFSEILIEIYTFSFKKIHLKMSSKKRQPICFSLHVLTLMLYYGNVLGNNFYLPCLVWFNAGIALAVEIPIHGRRVVGNGWGVDGCGVWGGGDRYWFCPICPRIYK